MTLEANGVGIDNVVVNGVAIDTVIANGVLVWDGGLAAHMINVGESDNGSDLTFRGFRSTAFGPNSTGTIDGGTSSVVSAGGETLNAAYFHFDDGPNTLSFRLRIEGNHEVSQPFTSIVVPGVGTLDAADLDYTLYQASPDDTVLEWDLVGTSLGDIPSEWDIAEDVVIRFL